MRLLDTLEGLEKARRKAEKAAEPILLKRVRLDGGTQPRVEMDMDLVDQYAADIDQLPPIDVVFDGKHYWPYDGFHRIKAHKKRRRAEIMARVVRGTREDAFLLSLGVNAVHGLRRTNADIRRACEMALQNPAWQGESDKALARACAVTPPTIAAHRRRLFPELPKNGQTEGVKVLPPAVIPELPESFLAAYDAMTPEQKTLFHQEKQEDARRALAKQDVRSWLERVEGDADKLRKRFDARPEVTAADIERVGALVGQVVDIARKYEG